MPRNDKPRFCRGCGVRLRSRLAALRYCSPECHARKCWGGVPTCERCGKPFLPAKVRGYREKPRFCSRRCQYDHQRGDAILTVGGRVAMIPLGAGLWAKVDVADLPTVAGRLWHAWRGRGQVFYAHAGASGRNSVVKMHHLILRVPAGMTVDHRDGDGLNNCRSNLRVATQAQQTANRLVNQRSRCGFKGVRPEGGRFLAYIGAEGRGKRYLGMFDTPEQAARAYDAAARQKYGEFAATNFPQGNERPARRRP